MQALSNASRSRLTRVLKPQILLLNSDYRFLSTSTTSSSSSSSSSLLQFSISPITNHQCQYGVAFTGLIQGNYVQISQHPMHSMMQTAPFSTASVSTEVSPTEAVKVLYDKILDSVNVKRTMSPNAWLWSMIENCKNHEDIKLLFDVLLNLRRFRLSNLRIHDNFNCALCLEVTKACARVGALDFGKKALWKHNVYGLTPSVGSANQLLLYAKTHKDANLMVEVMDLLKGNKLPLQPGTADIVFSICYDTDNWALISKYSKRFLKAGVKLRQTAFDTWMEFAAKIGDTESLWKIEKLRSESMKQHTLASAFACAKGCLLEHKPGDAAVVIQVLTQTLSDKKKPSIMVELQKLVDEWPLDVMKHQKEEKRKALAAILISGIPAMVTDLSSMGLEVTINLKDLTSKEGILC
ncbi:hypothetical protein CFOL_v3_30791 [Cephalotus follicularis]|uniref:Uncharacterized protein n=1 Tax=Cephalotus follicularis TaxID=3775 RepID=A0A1Q3D4H5_CEPFO|nr:hypothetical protein CFOL_v3_30791 [Cephalotus follicularis]